jgi:ABC-type uncharacterized transport system substrate-binding protein
MTPKPEGHMASHIGRRKFLATLGGAAAAWPLTVRGQQAPMPVVGFLHPSSPAEGYRVLAFRQGLKDAGFIDGENVAIEYRWADNQLDRLPTLAAELAQRRVAVIATGGFPSTFAAKAATATIPILRCRGRPGQAWSCHQPRPAGRQSYGYQFFGGRVSGKAAGTPA